MTGVRPEQARRVGIVGAGVIGGGWALHYLRTGFDVDVYDPSPDARGDLLRMVEASWPLLDRMGLREGASPDRLTFHDSLAGAVGDADVVQENAPENGPVKRRVLADVDRAARSGVVIASSTSGFAMTMLQADCEHPERCVVGHPFNPPYLIPVVEVVGGSRTDPAAVDWLVRFYAGTGKRPLRLSRELPGFVGNRLQEAMWREALHMVAAGEATVEEIDASIAFGPGLRWALMGPCLTFHLAGGGGGMAHMLDHFGAALEEPWTRPSEDIPVAAPAEDIPVAKLPAEEGTPRLAVENLRIVMPASRRRPEADVVDQVSFTVQPGHVLGLVGESGSGKTTVALALLGLVKRGLAIGGGKVLVDGRDILALSEHELQKLRGRTVAYVPQDPGSALNPVLKVGTQLREVFAVHGGNADRLTQVMAEAGLENPGPILASYPHQLSGGQQQRVALAMAFACRPRLIVLDEPTTGLDVTTQRRVLDTVRGLCRTYQVAAVYISHDLAVVAEIADHVAVLYSGRLIEIGAASELFSHPAHPYTRGLMRAVPSMESSHELLGMAGSPPRPGNRPAGCSFRPRCEFAIAECELREPAPVVVSHTGHAARCVRATEVIALSGTALLARDRTVPPAAEPVLTISRVSVSYTNKPVLRDVDLDVGARKWVAIVGTSGSGKTTLARCVVGLHKDWTGTITFAGAPLPPGVRGRTQDQLRKIQFVAQNPYSSLNPRQTIGQIIANPLTHFSKLPARERDKRIGDALTSVALRESFAARYPDELSGGERQRVALARALVVDPELLVCDEITSALDVSVQAAIVELLLRLQAERGLSLLFITHNLPLVRSIADDVTVISAGQVCEHGSVTQVLTAPKEAYTRQLIADVPGFEHAG